ncbi:MAG: hypothetical protein AB8B59_05875 [Maribacter sp.]
MKNLHELSTDDLAECNGGFFFRPEFTIPSRLDPIYPVCPPWEILIRPTTYRKG